MVVDNHHSHLIMSLKRGIPTALHPLLLKEFSSDISVIGLSLIDFFCICKNSDTTDLFRSPYGNKLFGWLPPSMKCHLSPLDLHDPSAGINGSIKALSLNSDSGRCLLSKDNFNTIVNAILSSVDSISLPFDPRFLSLVKTEDSGFNSLKAVQSLAHFYEEDKLDATYLPIPVGPNDEVRLAAKKFWETKLNGRSIRRVLLIGLTNMSEESISLKEKDSEKRWEYLESTMNMLAGDVDTLLPLHGCVAEVLRALVLGVNHIQISLPSMLAEVGIALYLDLVPPLDILNSDDTNLQSLTQSIKTTLSKDDSTKTVRIRRLIDKEFEFSDDCFSNVPKMEKELDKFPSIEPVQTDFAANYSSAYLHHLLIRKEHLAQQLLEWHNWRTMGLLFRIYNAILTNHGKSAALHYIKWIIETNLIMNETDLTDINIPVFAKKSQTKEKIPN